MKGTVGNSFYKLAPITISLIFLFLIYLLHSIGQNSLPFLSGGIILVFLFIAAFFLESKYMPYFGVLPNVVLLYILLENSAESVPAILYLYLMGGIILGLLTYLIFNYRSTKDNLYKTTFVLYSFKTILPLFLSYYLLGSYTNPFIIFSFVLFALLSWAFYQYVAG